MKIGDIVNGGKVTYIGETSYLVETTQEQYREYPDGTRVEMPHPLKTQTVYSVEDGDNSKDDE